LLFPLTLLASACGSQQAAPTGFCTAPAPIAIEATVTDSVSGRPLADSALGLVQAGSYVDSLHHVSTSPALLFGGQRLGTYQVTISRTGYSPWQRSGISVTQTGPCGNVLPVQLNARLQPAT
jgi:hypothetical protein